MRLDFPEMEALNEKVRRQRAEAIYDLVIAPLAKLFSRKRARHETAHTRRVAS